MDPEKKKIELYFPYTNVFKPFSHSPSKSTKKSPKEQHTEIRLPR